MASQRIPLVAGNWKMNFDHLEATYFVQQLAWKLRDIHFDYRHCEIALMPSFTSLRSGQVHDVTRDLSDEEASRLIVAYEPIWAIGSGMVATPQSAQDAAKAIRDDLAETFGTHVGESVRILYGGSVSSKNAEELIGEPDVDGFLIGGAALNVDELTRICQLTMNATV